MKTIKLILAATLAAALMTGCGSNNDKSDITPTPSSSPMTNTQQSGNNTSDAANGGMDGMGDAAKDLTDGAGNAVKGAVDGVQNAVGSMTGNN